MSKYFFKKIFLVLLLLISITSPSKGMLLENEENSLSGVVARILDDHTHDGTTPHVGNDKKTIEWEWDWDSSFLSAKPSTCDKCSTCETALYQYGFLASGQPVPENEIPSFRQPTGSVLSKWFHNEDEEVCPTTRLSLLPPYAPYIDTSKLMPGEPGYTLGFWNWQQIVTYRGRKMQRNTARSRWEEEQKYQEKVLHKKREENYEKETKEREENYEKEIKERQERQENYQKEIKRRQEKYEEEKTKINYKEATYKGYSLQQLRERNSWSSTLSLKDLEPQTVKDLEKAYSNTPERKKELAIIEKERRQAELQKRREEELEREKKEKQYAEWRKLACNYHRPGNPDRSCLACQNNGVR